MLRFPPRRILVPVDLSDVSLAGFAHARRWGDEFGASVEALYVIDDIPTAPWLMEPPRLRREVRHEVRARLRRRLGERVRLHVLEGFPVVTINRAARTLAADLVVLGTHGRQGWNRFLLGSVAEAVARGCPAPVLTAHGKPAAVHAVLAPVNFTPYSETGFFYAASLAAGLRKRLVALHVAADPERCPNPEFRLNNLIWKLPAEVRAACRPRAEVRTGKPVEQILLAGAAAGLVVLVAHRRPLLEDMVLGTTAERVLRHSSVPVLTLPSPETPLRWESWGEVRQGVGRGRVD